MNTPVFWAKARDFPAAILKPDEFVIGSVPSTNIGVSANIDDLVQFHTAILGVTGTGKTELALDIVREAVKNDFKVFCVDFTGEYKARLNDLNPLFPAPTPAQITDLEYKLFAVETTPFGAPAEKAALKTSLTQIRSSVETQVSGFLTGGERLAILELTEISNTKATLRITEQYLSTIMAWARKHRQARKVLIVLEEAHTIIPETFSSGFDGDTQWVVSRIGQIALQGRKYGVGLLVISQRTALVSKTILSQCNTFLTHSLIDQTSLTFLESVYSAQHVRSIPNLGRFEFLAAGKAIKAERPILLGRPFDQAKKDASDALRRPAPEDTVGAVTAA
jgi:DNA helicase HerA-like ATPase